MVNPQSKKESPTQPSTWNDTNQHWIPQFLLKGFGIRSKSSTIYELDKQTKVVTVRNVEKIASKQHLLTDRDDDLVKAIERRATEVISAIRKGNLDSIGEDGRQTIDRLVCAMMLDNPHGGADAEATREKVIHEAVGDLSEGVQRLGETPDETYFQSSLDEMLGHNWLSGFMGSASNWIVVALGLMALTIGCEPTERQTASVSSLGIHQSWSFPMLRMTRQTY